MAATTAVLTTASEWNNYGVQCIKYGDLNGALSHLRKALTVAMAITATPTTTSTKRTYHDSETTAHTRPLFTLQSKHTSCRMDANEDDDQEQDSSCPSKKRIKTGTIPKALSSFWDTTCQNFPAEVSSSSDEDVDTLSAQGIVMAPSPSDEFSISSKLTRFSSIQNQTISSAIITFNIGLVYHLVGRRGYGSLIHLQTAVSMYQDCHDLLSASCAFCSTGNFTLDLLAMALFYNMAHIYHNDLMDFPLAKNYSEQLVRFASCIVTSRYENRNQVMMIKHAMGDFLCNVMTIRNADQVAAAA
jgi:hypothetical protein